MVGEGFEIAFASYDAETTIETHCHETANYGVITKGEMLLTKAGVEKTYCPSEWYEIPPRCQHSSRFKEDTESVEIYMK